MTLARLEDRLREDLAMLAIPPANWVPPHPGSDTDVLVIGAGMLGLTASFALQRLGILRHRVIDAAPEGSEGPWVTFARMLTLRSPKELVGPAQDLPALTFRAWYEAQHGRAAWDALGKIPRAMWMDYLRWYRRVLGLPVTNGLRVTRIGPGPDGLVEVTTDREGVLRTRRLVLATGMGGLGGPRRPDWLPERHGPRFRHSSEAIDFAALVGKVVAVVGASASAVDNAAAALEAGAAEVHLLVRRPALPRLNRFKSMVHAGYTNGMPALDGATRIAILRTAFDGAVAPPRESLQRLAPFAGFRLHLATPVLAATEDAEGVTLRLPGGTLRAAQVILGTGFAVDLGRRPELADIAGAARLWRDSVADPDALGDFAAFPHLGAGFEFLPRVPGEAPWLGRVHAFNAAAMASLGLIGGDIPGVSHGARRLTEAIARDLFLEDQPAHLAALRAYATPELLGDELPPSAVVAPRRSAAAD